MGRSYARVTNVPTQDPKQNPKARLETPTAFSTLLVHPEDLIPIDWVSFYAQLDEPFDFRITRAADKSIDLGANIETCLRNLHARLQKSRIYLETDPSVNAPGVKVAEYLDWAEVEDRSFRSRIIFDVVSGGTGLPRGVVCQFIIVVVVLCPKGGARQRTAVRCQPPQWLRTRHGRGVHLCVRPSGSYDRRCECVRSQRFVAQRFGSFAIAGRIDAGSGRAAAVDPAESRSATATCVFLAGAEVAHSILRVSVWQRGRQDGRRECAIGVWRFHRAAYG